MKEQERPSFPASLVSSSLSEGTQAGDIFKIKHNPDA